MSTMHRASKLVTAICALPVLFFSIQANGQEAWKRHTIDASSFGADGVRAADANGDGMTDLVSSWEQGGLARVYLRTNSLNTPAWQAVTVGKSPNAEDAVFFDADDDGVYDVVSATEGRDRKILIHWAPSVEQYSEASEWRTEILHADGSQWMYSVPMDVDRRRGIDLVIGGKNKDASIGWLESPDDPRIVGDWRYHNLSEAGWIMSLLVMDMNDDGYSDILLSDRRGPMSGVRWLENPGPGASLTKPWVNHWVGARQRQVMLIDIADMDGDGIAEIIVPSFKENDYRLSIFKRDSQQATGELWTEFMVPYPEIAGRPKAVAVGDIDLDGRPDLVLASAQAYDNKQGIVWLRYRTTPFTSAWDTFNVSGAEGLKFDLNLLLDVDGDGDLDVINSEEHNNAANGNPGLGVIWYENPIR